MGYYVRIVDYHYPIIPAEFADRLQKEYPMLFDERWPVVDFIYIADNHVQITLSEEERKLREWYDELEKFTQKVARYMKKAAYVLFIGEEGDYFGFGWSADGKRMKPRIIWEVVKDGD